MLNRNPDTQNGKRTQSIRDRDVNVQIGLVIKQIRTAARISQEQLGDHLGITFQQVQKYEKGMNRIAASTLLEIAKFFRVSINDILPTTGAKPSDISKVSAEVGRLRKKLSEISAIIADRSDMEG